MVHRETINQAATATGVFDRELGGKRHYAAVKVKVGPRARGSGNRDVSSVAGGSSRGCVCTGSGRGHSGALLAGAAFGHPVVELLVELLDVEVKEGLASEMAFPGGGHAGGEAGLPGGAAGPDGAHYAGGGYCAGGIYGRSDRGFQCAQGQD